MNHKELRDRIMVALDFPSVEQARMCVQELKGIATYFKVGMELFYLAGPAFIYELKEQGFKVFVDLKMFDIPNTVKGAARSLTQFGVDMFNVHALGGVNMMLAAREGLEEGLFANQKRPDLIGVTILTSTDQLMMNDQMKIPDELEKQVIHLGKLAKQAGLDGVVASPLEVGRIKAGLGANFITVTPGIRPKGVEANDQKRTTTPAEAIQLGTDYMVLGRAITQANNKREAFELVLNEIVLASQKKST